MQAILSMRLNPSQVTENCSSSDDSLRTDVGHLPMKPYIIYAIVDFAKNVDSLLHTMVIKSDVDQPRPATTDCQQQWFVETLCLRI